MSFLPFEMLCIEHLEKDHICVNYLDDFAEISEFLSENKEDMNKLLNNLESKINERIKNSQEVVTEFFRQIFYIVKSDKSD